MCFSISIEMSDNEIGHHSKCHMTRTVSTGSESLFVPAEISPQHEHGVMFVGRSLPLPCSHHTDPLAEDKEKTM